MLTSTARVSRRVLAPSLSKVPTRCLSTTEATSPPLSDALPLNIPPLDVPSPDVPEALVAPEAPSAPEAPNAIDAFNAPNASRKQHVPSRAPTRWPVMTTPAKRSARLRTEKFMTSMVHAFTLLNAIEDKYGPVREIEFTKDYELPTRYQAFVNVRFKGSESYLEIPPTGERIQINSVVSNERPGGVGLDELAPLLEREDLTGAYTPPSKQRLHNDAPAGDKRDPPIAATVSRQDREQFVASLSQPRFFSRYRREETAYRFLKWGGFAKLDQIDYKTPIEDKSLIADEPPIDHIRMRRALRFAADTLDVPNPYETEPPLREGQQPARQTKVEPPAKPQTNIAWEALPGESDDLPTPGRVSDDASISTSTELPPNPLNMPTADADLLMDRTYIPSTPPIITEVAPPHHPVQPARSPKTPPIKAPPIKVQATTETMKSEKDASASTSKQKTTTIQQPTQPAKLTREQQREMETQLRMAQRAANMLAPEKKQKGKQVGAKGTKEKAPVAVIKRPSQSKRKEEGVEEDGMLTKLSSFFKLK